MPRWSAIVLYLVAAFLVATRALAAACLIDCPHFAPSPHLENNASFGTPHAGHLHEPPGAHLHESPSPHALHCIQVSGGGCCLGMATLPALPMSLASIYSDERPTLAIAASYLGQPPERPERPPKGSITSRC